MIRERIFRIDGRRERRWRHEDTYTVPLDAILSFVGPWSLYPQGFLSVCAGAGAAAGAGGAFVAAVLRGS